MSDSVEQAIESAPVPNVINIPTPVAVAVVALAANGARDLGQRTLRYGKKVRENRKAKKALKEQEKTASEPQS
jgi:hypothetical protein